MKTYTVRAKRWTKGWELHIDGVGVTQSRGLADAAEMARSYIAMMTEEHEGTFEVTVVPQIGGGLDRAVAEARRAGHVAEQAQRTATERSRSIARKLKDQQMSGRDIAKVLGISPQRVSQLLHDPQKRAASG